MVASFAPYVYMQVPFNFAILLIYVPVAPSGFWFDFLATQAMVGAQLKSN
jgi:hypothetical protein